MAGPGKDNRGGTGFLVAAICIGLAATAMCWLYLKKHAGTVEKTPMAEIVVASADLRAGTTLTDEMIQTKGVPADMTGVTGSAVRPEFIPALMGQKVNRLIPAGTPIQLSDIAPVRQIQLGADERALTLQIEGGSSLGQLLQPGDAVELYVTLQVNRPSPQVPAGGDAAANMMAAIALSSRPDPAAEYKTQKVLDDKFTVLAVGTRVERQLVLSDPQTESGATAATITIKVRNDQVPGILQATGAGQLPVTFVLCPRS